MRTKEELIEKLKNELNRVDPCYLKFHEIRQHLTEFDSLMLKSLIASLQRNPSIFVATRLEPVRDANRNQLYNYFTISRCGISAEFSQS